MVVQAGPSRAPDAWKPTRYLEPNHPDNEEVLEQAAYQAAVTRLGGDERRLKKYKPRRTVDYMGGVVKWRQLTKLKGIEGFLPTIHPNPSDLVGLLPPPAHRLNPSTSICDHFVHTSINKERSPTRIVRWTPDARRLLTGNDKGQFTLWNGASFNYESITQVHDDSIRDFCYANNGQALISADKTGTIKYFTPHLTNVHGFQGHREACHGLAWSPNDERFVSGGDDGLVKIWNYRAAREERTLSGHGWDVRCVDWHPTKGLVVSGSKDMLVKFWDPRTGKDLSTLHSHKAVVNTCKWSPSGHLVTTAGGDGVIRLFDIRTFRELEPMKGHSKEINCLTWHPVHHNILCSGDASGAIIYWSLLSPDPSQPVTVLREAHEDAVFSLAFHPLGHILCSGSKDFTARFWCRARPMGGHELDRWHLGEEGAMGAKMEAMLDEEKMAERARVRQSGKEADQQHLPGLPGLSNLSSIGTSGRESPFRQNQNQNSTPVPGLGGLPGFGGGGGQGAPPVRQWGGANGSDGSGFAKAQGPLPSQDEMLRQTAAPPRNHGQDRDRERDSNRNRGRGGQERGYDGRGGQERGHDGRRGQGGQAGYGGGNGNGGGYGGYGGPGQSGAGAPQNGYGGPGSQQTGYGGSAPPSGGYNSFGGPGGYPPPAQQGQGQNAYPPPPPGYGNGPAGYPAPPQPQQFPPPPQGGYGQGGYGQNGGGGGGGRR
ncbi:WD40-repeat-containing domain protein [Naematelia encephala]|uniref:Polyadenylation factor subunit 2 n=1 Tax=Naematelia encephala TaxID=71784 RepID=A0A1Y2AMC1_9TREE|nr:WD40-repeat-containing domain protein [Naematelia encephala]